MSRPAPIDTADLWWRHAVYYCLDVEIFQDSDGDGVGDIPGLISRVPYLADLGITCLWLMPFFPTEHKDDGYDVTDYFTVDPRVGSLGDLVELIRVARSHGIRIIIDFVMNHTSDKHPWFEQARRSKDDPKRHWYVWRDEPPEDPHPPFFPDQEDSTWSLDEKTGQYYLHHFLRYQPDLNVEHPQVRREIEKNLGLWLEIGVAGFRFDSVPFLFSSSPTESGAGDEDGEVAEYDGLEHLARVRGFVSRRSGEAVLLGEVNVTHERQMDWFGDPNEGLHLQFDFPSMQRLYLALARGEAAPLAEMLRSRPPADASHQWASFVRNHDELTLDQLSDEERDEVFEAFAPDEDMRVYGRGIRRRLPPMLGDERAVRMVYAFMFSLPDAPVLFYGEEIGMGENLDLHGRLAVRTPMQWSREGGFSTAPPEDWVRAEVQGEYGREHVNVADQRADPGSLWSHIRRLSRLYRDTPQQAWSSLEMLDGGPAGLLSHVCRGAEWSMLALHDLSGEGGTVRVTLDADRSADAFLTDRLTGERIDASASVTFDLEPYGWRWLLLDPADAGVRIG
ncbi:alpha-amylase family glycosyl hydrolase [Microbacterium album]|uniref:Alpha-amylase n=1 Tax=Microbacterium album TaxID=2053191 RepID=A0A917IH95_9MICO|nr:alpha-amylase family glycosyl hydrolase [Microbacterium album]GGH46822.1 alpha-amylase [Microbacterium album]